MPKKKTTKKTASSASAATSPAPPAEPKVTRYQRFQPVTIHRRQLSNAPYNPRQITSPAASNLREGLRTHGFVGGIVWNKQTGHLIGGHQRLAQLDSLEGTDDYRITVDAVDLPESKEKALNILLNNPEAQGQFDLEMLEDLIGSLKAEDPDFDIRETGFDLASAQKMFGPEFLSAFAAEQAVAEAEDVDTLSEMRDASAQPKAELPHPNSPPPKGTPEYEEWRERTYGTREGYQAEKAAAENAADTIITFVFDRADQVPAFLRSLNLDRDARYFPATVLAEALGISLE